MVRKSLVLIFLSLLVCSGLAQQAPVDMLRGVTQTSIDQLTQYKSQHPGQQKVPFQVIYNIVDKQLLPHMAIDYMLNTILTRQCQYTKPQGDCAVIDLSAIPKAQWAQLRQEYIVMMVGLYGSALSEADKYKILFRKSRREVAAVPGAVMEVDSQVVMPNTEPIRITYQLIFQNGEWRVYDFSINGAISVANNLRAQFAPVIQQDGIPGLLKFLQQHNAAVRKQDSVGAQ